MIDRLMPVAASAHAPAFDGVLWSVHLHVAVQALAWGAFLIFCLIRFRGGRPARPVGSGPRPLLPVLAIGAVVAGDAVLLAASALPAWFERSTPPANLTAPLEVRVEAEQFAWNIHYPGPDGRFGATRVALISASNPLGIDRRDASAGDDIGVLNVLTVPVGRPIVVHLTARDVIHSFTLNEMRVKQDATPGLVVRTWFTPTITGKWDIGCSQLCGLGHYRMRGGLSVVTEDEWNRWMETELALLTPKPGPR
jgi:cytochrome c oxidase subunit 2